MYACNLWILEAFAILSLSLSLLYALHVMHTDYPHRRIWREAFWITRLVVTLLSNWLAFRLMKDNCTALASGMYNEYGFMLDGGWRYVFVIFFSHFKIFFTFFLIQWSMVKKFIDGEIELNIKYVNYILWFMKCTSFHMDKKDRMNTFLLWSIEIYIQSISGNGDECQRIPKLSSFLFSNLSEFHFCFFNLWLKKALNRCQKINFQISPFPLFIYDLHWKKSRLPKMYVSVSVCVSVCLSVCL